jgi:hypothetical protein
MKLAATLQDSWDVGPRPAAERVASDAANDAFMDDIIFY